MGRLTLYDHNGNIIYSTHRQVFSTDESGNVDDILWCEKPMDQQIKAIEGIKEIHTDGITKSIEEKE